MRRTLGLLSGLAVVGTTLVGVPPASTAATSSLGWNLSNWFGGTGDVQCSFGQAGDQIVAGDWDADGRDGPGVFRNGVWYLAHYCGGPVVAEVRYGQAGDIAVVGDWDGNGTETIGVWRQSNWYLSNDFTGYTHHLFTYGTPTDTPVVGDWDGNSTTTVGVFRGDGWWHLTDALGGNPNHNFAWGATGDLPLIGDWNGDRKDSPGFRRGIEWNLTNNLGGAVDAQFVYGPTTDQPIVGDWDGNGTTTPGIVSGEDPAASGPSERLGEVSEELNSSTGTTAVLSGPPNYRPTTPNGNSYVCVKRTTASSEVRSYEPRYYDSAASNDRYDIHWTLHRYVLPNARYIRVDSGAYRWTTQLELCAIGGSRAKTWRRLASTSFMFGVPSSDRKLIASTWGTGRDAGTVTATLGFEAGVKGATISGSLPVSDGGTFKGSVGEGDCGYVVGGSNQVNATWDGIPGLGSTDFKGNVAHALYEWNTAKTTFPVEFDVCVAPKWPF